MKRVMGPMVLTAALFGAGSAWAGKFEVIGEGSATMAAEFIRIDINLQSECHSSALRSRQMVDELTEKALLALRSMESDIPQQLQVSPGANLQAIKTEYVNNEKIVVCDEDHAWTSTTDIQFRLNDLKKLAALQDSLLQLNDSRVPNSAKNVPRVTISLAKPVAGVLADTWDKMSDLALKRALDNALRQVKVLTTGMNQNSIELVKVEATKNSSGQAIYDRVDTEGDTAGIGLGSVSLKLSRQFTYRVGP